MLTKTVKYTDLDDNETEETIYFNLLQSEVMENEALAKELTDTQALLQSLIPVFEEPERELTEAEVRLLMEIVKRFMKVSYGIRVNAKQFKKSPEIWQDFKESVVYGQLLMDIFGDPEQMYAFVVGIFPKEVQAQAEVEIQKAKDAHPSLFGGVEAPSTVPVEIASATDAIAVSDATISTEAPTITATPADIQEDARPAWLREDRLPTDAEINNMSRQELGLAMRFKMSKSS